MRRTDVGVGAVIIMGIAVIFFGTIWLKGGALGREETTVRAAFREIGQLMEGNAVKLRGVPIGRVEDIALNDDGEGVIVTVRIASDAPLPQNPIMLLSPESMFGDWQAEIYPRNRFPDYEYTEPREAGVMPGASLPDISRLTAVADRIAENLAVLSDRIQIAFTEETAIQLRDAIENVSGLSEDLGSLVNRQEASIEGLTTDLNEMTAILTEAAVSVRSVAQQFETAVGEGRVESILTSAQQASMQIDSLTEAWVALSSQLAVTVQSADTALTSLSKVASAAASGEGTIGLLLQDTTLYRQLVLTNAQLQALIEDIKKNPRRYINLEIF